MFEVFALCLFIGIIFMIDKKPFSKKKLREQVRWCTTRNHFEGFYYDDLYDWTNKLKIEKEYRLNVEEGTTVKEIIKEHQEELRKNFVEDNLKVNRWISSFTFEEYFFFSLTAFLRKNFICDYKIRGSLLNKNLYDTTYELSEYGLIFSKLYLLSELVCEQSKKINKNGDFYSSEKIKEIIKHKQITIYYA